MMNTFSTIQKLHHPSTRSLRTGCVILRQAQDKLKTAKFIFCLMGIALLVSCEERGRPKINPIGVWENTTHWDNNAITLTVYPDSTMSFKCVKSFCPGTKFFVSVGKWHIEQDSFLVMEQFTDSTKFDLRELFPELVQTQRDSNNVIALSITAKLLMADSMIYDISAEGKRVQEHMYRKTEEIKN